MRKPTAAQWLRVAGFSYGPGIGRQIARVLFYLAMTAWSALCWACVPSFPLFCIACGTMGLPGLLLLLLVVFGLVWPLALWNLT